MQNNVRKMSKRELLELLVLQSKKIDKLQEELNKKNELLKEKKLEITNAGSIAEASLKLNKVFEKAQQAADQYLINIKMLKEEQEKMNIKLKNEYNKKKQVNKKNNLKIDL